MGLRRRELLLLAGVATLAAASGFIIGPALLRKGGAGEDLLESAGFTDLGGKQHRVSEWRGRVLVVNFWATWCEPCREEIPMFQKAREHYATSGVEFVGIAVDSEPKVLKYVSDTGIAYPVLVTDASGIALMRKLGNEVGGLPYTVFLDRNGKIAGRKLGPMNRQELDRRLAALLPSDLS